MDVQVLVQLRINGTTTTMSEEAEFLLEDTFVQFSESDQEPSEWGPTMADRPQQPESVPFLFLQEPSPILLDPRTSDTRWASLQVNFEFRERGGTFRSPTATDLLSTHTPYDLRISVAGPCDTLAQVIQSIMFGGARLTLWYRMQANTDAQVLDGLEMDAPPDVEHNITLLNSGEQIVRFEVEIRRARFSACSSKFNDSSFYLGVVSADNRILFSSRETPFKTTSER